MFSTAEIIQTVARGHRIQQSDTLYGAPCYSACSVAKKHQDIRILFCQKNNVPLTNAFQVPQEKLFFVTQNKVNTTASRAVNKNDWLSLVHFKVVHAHNYQLRMPQQHVQCDCDASF